VQQSGTISYHVATFNLRTRIFVSVFAIACVASLAFVFSRPAVYLSSARLKVEAPPGQRQNDQGDNAVKLLMEAQALTSGAILDEVAQRINRSNSDVRGAIGTGDSLRDRLGAVPVASTNVIELRSEGSERELLPQVLNAWIEVYRESHIKAYDQSSTLALEENRNAVQQLRQNLAAKREDIEQFRKKFDIVSQEREENQAMAQLKGLNAALNDARSREVNAEARLNAIRNNVAAGKALVRQEDKAIIADLEKRAIELRDKIRDFENDYTPQYLAIDTKYKALRANLVRLEQRIERDKQASAQQALRTAEEELVSARQAVLRLQQDLAKGKRGVQEFTTRFAEHRAMVNEMRRLEESYDSAQERLAQLEIEKKGVGPKVTILSQPSVPDRPDRPDYSRDALIAVAGSAVLGLMAVWFVEFFKRSGMPKPVPVTQPIIHLSYPPNALLDVSAPALAAPPVLQLSENVARWPRELSSPEVGALWDAGSPDARLAIAGMLGGLSIQELAALRHEDIDIDAGCIRTPGASSRSLVAHEPLKQLLSERHSTEDGQALLSDPRGEALSIADLEGLIACAACDAGLAYPAEVNSEVLRHTYAAYLVRQGARLADIGGIIGHVSPATVRDYGRLSPPGPGLPLEQIDPIFPALRRQST
jgi:succinoglycan biosynthesis transport protein ExoP